MKLFFDARYIRVDFHDGISRYSAELAAALARITPVTFLICDERQREFLPADATCLTIHSPTSAREPFTARLLNVYAPDVVFSPMQTMGSGGRSFSLILTLHDMIYYRHRTPPRDLNPLVRLGWRLFHLSYIPQRLTLNGADIVATVSQTSRHDFERVRLTKRPIAVIPNAPQQLLPLLTQPFDSSEATQLIYMGSFMPYKNVETLIRGLAFLPGHTLHLLSRISPQRQAELTALAPSGAQIVFHNGVTDAEYAALLADRALLVSASLDEGYGLPLAEALALGVPAVVSDLPIFHEVAGAGARYFSAQDPRAFATAVTELADPDTRARTAAAGLQHIAEFSWENSAQRLFDIAHELASHRL